MASLEKRIRRPGAAEAEADTTTSTRRRAGAERATMSASIAADGQSVSSSLLSRKKRLGGADDPLDGPMGWSNRKIFLVGVLFLGALWLVCFIVSSLMIAVLLRVTY